MTAKRKRQPKGSHARGPAARALRRDSILRAALAVASEPNGFAWMSRPRVGRLAGCSDALVSQYFGTMEDLRTAVMQHAVEHELDAVVLQGIVAGHPVALAAGPELKARAVASAAL